MVGYSVAKEPTETPLTFTAYAASAIGAKLSFAFTLVTIRWSIHNSPHLYLPSVDPISPPSEED